MLSTGFWLFPLLPCRPRPRRHLNTLLQFWTRTDRKLLCSLNFPIRQLFWIPRRSCNLWNSIRHRWCLSWYSIASSNHFPLPWKRRQDRQRSCIPGKPPICRNWICVVGRWKRLTGVHPWKIWFPGKIWLTRLRSRKIRCLNLVDYHFLPVLFEHIHKLFSNFACTGMSDFSTNTRR